ncbi:MAG TPA: hypothetical protein VMV44_03440 [Rectinemataceae bacterium]|nr:hypothetical protein [Rectinemataceae bacterium]
MRTDPLAASAGLPATVLGIALLVFAPPPLFAADAEAGGWTMSADAAAGATLAADGIDPASADSAALWVLSANFLHRYEGQGWGLVLSDSLDLSGKAAAASGTGGTETLPAFAPLLSVYEAYARLDIGDWGQLFVGKRRMGLGIGTVFAPGDLIDPRSGFWDQKTGFSGIDFAASLGSDVALRAALSLDANFSAWAAGMAAKSADAQAAADLAAATASGVLPSALIQATKIRADAAYAAALDGSAGPADPRLMTWAFSTDAQLGSLQLAAAGVYRPEAIERPSLGFSYDFGGLILQAEAAAELFADGAASLTNPDLYGTGGFHYMWSDEADSLSLALDYDYNGRAGLLAHNHYLLPWISYTRDEVLNAYARALVGLGDGSAIVSLGLTFYPAQGFDLEFTALFCAGSGDGEFSTLSSLAPIPSPGAGEPRVSCGVAARVHF